MILTADNPSGINYAFKFSTMEQVKSTVGKIANKGATNIKLNGVDIPTELINQAINDYGVA